jgi:hypothetical protein
MAANHKQRAAAHSVSDPPNLVSRSPLCSPRVANAADLVKSVSLLGRSILRTYGHELPRHARGWRRKLEDYIAYTNAVVLRPTGTRQPSRLPPNTEWLSSRSSQASLVC